MICPNCSSRSSKVIDSRPKLGGIRRRRECLSCCKRFTTTEAPVDGKPIDRELIERFEDYLTQTKRFVAGRENKAEPVINQQSEVR